MSRFTGKLCPVCRTAFLENNDVVVCPECGTPHHRDCYRAIGKCGVTDKHAEGFVWSGRLPDEAEAEAAPEQPVQPQTPKFSDPHCAEYPSGTPTENNMQEEAPEFLNSVEQFIYEISGISDDDERGSDGVSGKELCCYAGKSLLHYGQAFSAFRKGVMKNGVRTPVKIFFNICSGLFAPIHQFYRRLDWLGILVLIVNALTSIPEMLIYYVNSKVITIAETELAVLGTIGVFCTAISFGVTILLCIFGDYIYYRHCVRRIKSIRLNFEDGKAEGYYQALAERGAPSKLRAVIGILAYLLVMEFTVRIPMLF